MGLLAVGSKSHNSAIAPAATSAVYDMAYVFFECGILYVKEVMPEEYVEGMVVEDISGGR